MDNQIKLPFIHPGTLLYPSSSEKSLNFDPSSKHLFRYTLRLMHSGIFLFHFSDSVHVNVDEDPCNHK